MKYLSQRYVCKHTQVVLVNLKRTETVHAFCDSSCISHCDHRVKSAYSLTREPEFGNTTKHVKRNSR